MGRTFARAALRVAMGLAIGCGGESASRPVDGGRVAYFVDGDNFGDGRDLTAEVVGPGPSADVAELRVIVVEAAAVDTFDASQALDALPSAYLSLPGDTGTAEVTFSDETTDHLGARVADGGSYAAVVLTVFADGEAVVSTPSEVVTVAVTRLVRTLTEPIQAGSGGLDADAAGNVYTADFGTSLGAGGVPGSRIHKVTPAGEVSVFATGLRGASGNDFGPDGDLFQSNIAGNTISRIKPDGTVSTFASEGLRSPVGIAVDSEGTLFVANCGDNTIQQITAAGESSQLASSPLFACPNGITLASDGFFYVSNFSNGDVVRVSRGGEVSAFANIPGNNNGHILFGNGVLYVVGRSANRLYELTLSGELSVLAGSGARGRRDGAALTARLSLTNDVALSPDGRILYFNDVVGTGDPQVLAPVVVRALTLVAEPTVP